MPIHLVTAPLEEPLSLAEAKAHLRVDTDDEDALIQDLIITARERIELMTERALVTQTWQYSLDAFPTDPQFALSWQTTFSQFTIPKPPLQTVTSITYLDVTSNPLGVLTTVPAANYIVDTASEPGRVVLAYGQTWPTVPLVPRNGVVVTLVAGYGAPKAVPLGLRQAMKFLIAHFYEFREPVMAQRGVVPQEVPFTVDALVWGFKVYSPI